MNQDRTPSEGGIAVLIIVAILGILVLVSCGGAFYYLRTVQIQQLRQAQEAALRAEQQARMQLEQARAAQKEAEAKAAAAEAALTPKP
jgi:uncharacterized protein HemX